MVYALGPLGFPLRFTGWWPAHLYDAAMALGALLALGAPVAAARVATRRADGSMPARSRVRQGAMAGLCTGVTAALVVAVLSTATIALLPYDAGLRNWAAGHIGQWTPVVGQVAPVGRHPHRLRGGEQRLRGRVPHRAPAQPGGGLCPGRLGRPVRRPRRSCSPGAAARRSCRPGLPGWDIAVVSSTGVAGLHLRYGQPLLDAAARRRAGVLLACCAILVVALGCSSPIRPRLTASIMPSTLRSLPGWTAIRASRRGLPSQVRSVRPWR